MKIKKREVKTQLITLSLVLTTFLSSFSYVYAFGYSIKELSFTHGEVQISTNIGNEQTVYNHDSTDIINYLQFTFDGYYTGTVKLSYTYSSSNPFANISDWNVIVIGGVILSKAQSSSNSYITFQVTDRNEFTVIMTYNMSSSISTINAGTNTVFTFSSATSSLSAITNHNEVYNNVAAIDAQLITANTNLNSIITRLTTANGLYTDILGNTNDIEAYLAQLTDQYANTLIEQQLGNIQLSLASMFSEQQTANSTLSDIYSSLGSIDPNSSDVDILTAVNLISSNISGLAQNVANMYARVNEINQNVASINNKLASMQQDLSGLLSTVQGIDNLIDTISWNSILNTTFYYSSSPTADQSEWQSNSISTNDYQTLYFYIPKSGFYDNKIYKIRALIYGHGNLIQMKYEPYGYVVGANIYPRDFNLYSQYSRNEVCMYIYPDTNVVMNSDSVFVVIKVSAISGNIRYSKSTTNNYFSIDDDDVEYWQLLNYFQKIKQYQTVNNFDASLYSKLNDVIDAINNIQVTVNVTEQEITNITNNFDTDIDTIHNVENNYKIDFDGWNNQLQSSDLSVDLSPYNSTVNFLKTNITNLWSNPFVNLPIIVSCLCFVFMVILG